MSEHCEDEEAEYLLRDALVLLNDAEGILLRADRLVAQSAWEECLQEDPEPDPPPEDEPMSAEALSEVQGIRSRAAAISKLPPRERLQYGARLGQLKRQLRRLVARQ